MLLFDFSFWLIFSVLQIFFQEKKKKQIRRKNFSLYEYKLNVKIILKYIFYIYLHFTFCFNASFCCKCTFFFTFYYCHYYWHTSDSVQSWPESECCRRTCREIEKEVIFRFNVTENRFYWHILEEGRFLLKDWNNRVK